MNAKVAMDQYEGLGTPDDKKKQKVNRASRISSISDILKAYEGLFHNEEYLAELSSYAVGRFNPQAELLQKTFPQVLTQSELTDILAYTLPFEDYERYPHVTAQMVTQLIQNSFDHNYNGFTLDMSHSSVRLPRIGWTLEGKSDRKLELTINGDVMQELCEQGKHLKVLVNGHAGMSVGSVNEHSEFEIYGDTYNGVGSRSQRSAYRIHGSTGSIGFLSKNCFFEVDGATGPKTGAGSEHSSFILHKFELPIGHMDGAYESKNGIYQTSDPEDFRLLVRKLPRTNRARLVDVNGQFLKEKYITGGFIL